MSEIPTDHLISRRTLIGTATLIPLGVLTSSAQRLQSNLPTMERQILEAFVNRLIPGDEYGPGASESGVVDYIDRSLSEYLAMERAALLKGLAAVEAFAQRRYRAPFAQLLPGNQDEVVAAMESNFATGFQPDSRTFFLRIRQLTFEGMFGDPFYGGNRAFAGWELIRYPGPRLAVSSEDQRIRVEIKPIRASGRGESGH